MPDTGDTPTIPAAAMPATTPPNTDVEETRVARPPPQPSQRLIRGIG